MTDHPNDADLDAALAEYGNAILGAAQASDLAEANTYLTQRDAAASRLHALLRRRVAEAAVDTRRLDAIQSGAIEIECMGTTVRYFNAWHDRGSSGNSKDLRAAIDAAIQGAAHE